MCAPRAAGTATKPSAPAAGPPNASRIAAATACASARAHAASRPLEPAPEAAAVPERITSPELRRLWEMGEPLTVLDVRTERSYRDDPEIATGAIRMPPDDAVRMARERGLQMHGTVVLYCT
jgi:hypothetical protein